MSLEPARFQLGDELTLDGWVGGSPVGEPVVLLHGFPQTSLAFLPVAQRLVGEGCQVVVPDQRGYSPDARPLDVADYRTELLVQDVVGVLDALGWEGAHVVGHDWGAVVAWTMAATLPDRVKSLTALSVPHPAALARALATDADQQQRSAYVQVFAAEIGVAERALLADGAAKLRALYGPEVAPEAVEEYVRHLSEPGALSAALAWYRAGTPADLMAVRPVTAPTTFVWGAQDVAVGRVAAEGAAALVTGPFRFEELPDQGHWLPDSCVGQVTAAVLDRIRPGRPPA